MEIQQSDQYNHNSVFHRIYEYCWLEFLVYAKLKFPWSVVVDNGYFLSNIEFKKKTFSKCKF